MGSSQSSQSEQIDPSPVNWLLSFFGDTPMTESDIIEAELVHEEQQRYHAVTRQAKAIISTIPYDKDDDDRDVIGNTIQNAIIEHEERFGPVDRSKYEKALRSVLVDGCKLDLRQDDERFEIENFVANSEIPAKVKIERHFEQKNNLTEYDTGNWKDDALDELRKENERFHFK
jgi:hypothetical protein